MRFTARGFTAVYVESADGGYIAYVEEIPGLHVQGETIEEARQRLGEALEWMMDDNRERNRRAFGGCRVVSREPLSPGGAPTGRRKRPGH